MRLYDTFDRERDHNLPLYAEINGIVTPIYIGNFSQQGKDKAVIEFDDFDNELRAREIVGLEILAPLTEEEEEDISLGSLVGYALNDKNSGKSGIITGFIDNPNNPLFEVDIDGIEIYVPAVEEVILGIDIDAEYVDASLPDGLLDLYESPEGYDEY